MEPRMHDDLKVAKDYQELAGATGVIEAGSSQVERLDEVTERLLSGEFHVKTNETSLCKCIDGRMADRGAVEGLNSAGGSLSYVVADDLTTKRFAGDSFAEAIDNTLEVLRGQGQAVGAHTDSHAAGEKSGCGANDRLSEIYAKMVEENETIRAAAAEILGQDIDDQTHELIYKNAAERTDFANGAANLITMKTDGAQVEKLEGNHHEVLAVINFQPGTTLDRAALKTEFGDNYQAFNIDAHGFEKAAHTISINEQEKQQKIVALTYYNLATAHVLCGPSMRVGVLPTQ